MATAETFKIGGQLIEFQSKDGLLLKGCETQCLALKTVGKFKKINLQAIRAKEPFVGPVGSDVCRLVYKVNSIIGINENKDQRAFCVFKDNSLIEINSLGLYLLEKKMVKE